MLTIGINLSQWSVVMFIALRAEYFHFTRVFHIEMPVRKTIFRCQKSEN